MKSSSSDLFDLLKTLSDPEIKEVRDQLRKSEGSETNISKLFEYLINSKTYNADDLLNHFNGTFNKKNLPPTKNRLKGFVLDVLRDLRLKSNASFQMRTRQQHDHLEILCLRGLFKPALSLINKLKKEARLEGQPFNDYVALSGETYIAHSQLKLKKIYGNILKEMEESKQDMVRFVDSYNFYTLTNIYSKTNNLIRDYSVYKEILGLSEHPALKMEREIRGLYTKHNLLEARVNYHFMLQEYKKAFQIQGKIWELMKKNRAHMLKGKGHLFMNAITNYVLYAINARLFKEAESGLEELKEELQKNKAYNNVIYQCEYHLHLLDLYYRKGVLAKDKNTLDKCLEFYKKNHREVLPHQRMEYEFILMCHYLDQNQPDKSIDFCNALLSNSRTNENNVYVQEYAEILKIFIDLERPDIDIPYIQDYARQYYKRKILKNKAWYPFEMEVIKFVNQLAKLSPTESPKSVWEKLYKEILDIRKNDKIIYFGQLLHLYDILGWVEGKVLK